MNITLSISDELHIAAELAARRRGITLEEFLIESLERVIHRNRVDESLIEQINAVCAKTSTALDPVLAELQWLSLAKQPWDYSVTSP